MLREKEIQGERLGFKYIIVDEYQDISRQRFNLILELSKLCDAKIVAVGDDWQSIYAYARNLLGTGWNWVLPKLTGTPRK